jgi:nucleotide-binding universal stress UspA family protein
MEETTIVYPTDFSSCSENAKAYVKAIAKATMSKVKVIHSLDLMGIYATQITAADTSLLIKTLEESSQEKLNKIKEEFVNESISCETELINGTEMNWLPQVLKKIKPYLVVMGTTGSGEMENKIFGSLTHKIITNAEFPVLAIPQNANYKGIHQVVFATDFKESDVEHIQYVVNITKKYYPKLDIVHVAQGEFKDTTEEIFLKDFEDELFVKVNYPKMSTQLLYSEDVEDRLNTLVRESKADLMVLVSTKRTFFERIFSHSLTKQMVYHSDTPLLVF